MFTVIVRKHQPSNTRHGGITFNSPNAAAEVGRGTSPARKEKEIERHMHIHFHKRFLNKPNSLAKSYLCLLRSILDEEGPACPVLSGDDPFAFWRLCNLSCD